MAQPTSEHHISPPQQASSPNVGRQGAQPTPKVVERPDPVLIDDIEPVHFVRLYPEAVETSAARTLALEAGKAAKAYGDTLIAAQQQPVVVLGEEPPHAQQQPAHPHADKRG